MSVQAVSTEAGWLERSHGMFGQPKHTCSLLSQQTLASSNVEGLGPGNSKTDEIIIHMRDRDSALMCKQETQRKGQHRFCEDELLVLLSGIEEGKLGRAKAGVFFFVAPWAIPSTVGFW